MKLKKWFAAVLVLALLLTGCADGIVEIDDSALRPNAEVLLNSFVANDQAACRGVLDENVSGEDLEGYFTAIHTELKDLGSYEMTAIAWDRKIMNEEDVTGIRYLIEGEGGKYYLTVSMQAGRDKLSGFRIEAAEADAEPTTGAGPLHWVVTAIGGAVMAFVFWMVVDCARRKMKRKWLWILLILGLMVILTLRVQGSDLGFNFHFGFFPGMTGLSTFLRGGFKLTVYVPLGAMVYFFKRKELTLQEESHAEGKEEA